MKRVFFFTASWIRLLHDSERTVLDFMSCNSLPTTATDRNTTKSQLIFSRSCVQTDFIWIHVDQLFNEFKLENWVTVVVKAEVNESFQLISINPNDDCIFDGKRLQWQLHLQLATWLHTNCYTFNGWNLNCYTSLAID